MSQLQGKVAFITGLARGQGRSHALTLAREGASIIGLDLCEKPLSTPYPGATTADLDETIRLVEEVGGKIVAERADVRDLAQVQAVFDAGIAHFGRVDIVLPNAGICAGGMTWEITLNAGLPTVRQRRRPTQRGVAVRAGEARRHVMRRRPCRLQL